MDIYIFYLDVSSTPELSPIRGHKLYRAQLLPHLARCMPYIFLSGWFEPYFAHSWIFNKISWIIISIFCCDLQQREWYVLQRRKDPTATKIIEKRLWWSHVNRTVKTVHLVSRRYVVGPLSYFVAWWMHLTPYCAECSPVGRIRFGSHRHENI